MNFFLIIIFLILKIKNIFIINFFDLKINNIFNFLRSFINYNFLYYLKNYNNINLINKIHILFYNNLTNIKNKNKLKNIVNYKIIDLLKLKKKYNLILNKKKNYKLNFFFKKKFIKLKIFIKKKKFIKLIKLKKKNKKNFSINLITSFIIKLKRKNKKKIFYRLKNKKKFFFKNFNFNQKNLNLNFLLIYFKYSLLKHQYKINKILNSFYNKLLLLILKNKKFKGFKIEIKGRFKKRTRSSYVMKSLGSVALSTKDNKIFYLTDIIKTRYGLSSIKIFFLIDNSDYQLKKKFNKVYLKI